MPKTYSAGVLTILNTDNQILVFLILILHLNNLQKFLIKGKTHKNIRLNAVFSGKIGD